MARFLKMESPQTEAKFGNMVKKFGNTRNFKIGFGPVIGNQFLFQNTQSKQRKLSVIGIIHALYITAFIKNLSEKYRTFQQIFWTISLWHLDLFSSNRS